MSKKMIWAPAFTSVSIICVSIISNLSALSFTAASTRPDSGLKVILSGENSHMLYLSFYVPFVIREHYFYTISILVKGLHHSIYQKREQKIEQTSGPDQHPTYNIWLQMFLSEDSIILKMTTT